MNIKNEIIEFINADENNGALLITGSWGCGKSYLVKIQLGKARASLWMI